MPASRSRCLGLVVAVCMLWSAWAAGAVAETLQGAGVLLRSKQPAIVAGLLQALLEDAALRGAVLATQQEVVRRLRRLDYAALLAEGLRPLLADASPTARGEAAP